MDVTIAFAHKSDGSLRFSLDYRKPNAVIVKNCYPLPQMDNFKTTPSTINVSPNLDANSDYWLAVLNQNGIDKTTFVTHNALYSYIRMSFE